MIWVREYEIKVADGVIADIEAKGLGSGGLYDAITYVLDSEEQTSGEMWLYQDKDGEYWDPTNYEIEGSPKVYGPVAFEAKLVMTGPK